MTWGIKCKACFRLRTRGKKVWCGEKVNVRNVAQQEGCEKWEGEEWEREPGEVLAEAIRRAGEED